MPKARKPGRPKLPKGHAKESYIPIRVKNKLWRALYRTCTVFGGEYVLMYDDVRASSSPDRTVRDFLESTYEAGASLAKWNRAELERH